MDYTTLVLEHQLNTKRELHDVIFEQMEMESQFIMSCLENMSITMEAVATKKELGGFLKAITDFVKKIFTTFSNVAKKLFQTNQAWMAENFHKLDKIDYSGLEIEMVPFWTMLGAKNNRAQQEAAKLADTLTRSRQSKYKSMDTLKKEVMGDYLDENDELAGGLKNYYRTGNPRGPLKTVKLAGDDLKSKVNGEFRPFCEAYNTVIISGVKKTADEVDHLARIIENEMNKRNLKPAAESYCMVEGLQYNQTELAYCENFVVLEADNSSEEKKDEKKEENKEGTKEQPADDKKKVKPSKVQMTDHGNNEKAEAAKDAETASDDDLLASKNALNILQTIVAAQMTVCEEAFHAYLDAMKQILSVRTTKEGPKAAPKEDKKKTKKDKK